MMHRLPHLREFAVWAVKAMRIGEEWLKAHEEHFPNLRRDTRIKLVTDR